MTRRNGDSVLTEALKRGTGGAARQKERVWRNVSAQLPKSRQERKQDEMRRKRNLWMSGAFAATVVVLATVFFSLTPEGTALADRIVKFFAPEIRMNTQIEGGTETHNAALQGNSTGEAGYVIYIDSERYRKESAGGVDYYKALNAPDGYPPVQMEISQLPDAGAEETYNKVLAEAEEAYDLAEGRGQVDKPVKGWWVLAYDDGGGEAPYEEIYVVDNTKGGCFVIRCKMFREASEGHGARFYAMLETFEVVDPSQVETALPTAPATPQPQQRRLTWDDLAIYGVRLDTAESDAVARLSAEIQKAGGNPVPVSDETTEDAGGTTRTVKWDDGTTAVIRNGKVYSLESASASAVLPIGLHAGMGLDDFTAVLGEPHEAIGALAWGVGSNDNLIVVVENGIVKSMKVSLIE